MEPSLPSRLLPLLVRGLHFQRPFITRAGAERHLHERTLRPRSYAPPHRLRRDVVIEVESTGPWPVYTITPATSRPVGGLVYVHGGGWVNEISSQHWHLAAQIAAEARLAVTVPIYPLIPHGTAAEVVEGVADLVTASAAAYGPTSLAGDSAGGQIALSTALQLRDGPGVILPQTVLISPALDLSLANPDIDALQPMDPWLGREGTRLFIDHWRGGLALDDPRVSPLAADLRGLGPITLFSGTRDILNPDTHLLVEALHAAGVPLDFHEGPGLLHVYTLTPTPEGRRARATIVEQLRTAHPAAG